MYTFTIYKENYMKRNAAIVFLTLALGVSAFSQTGPASTGSASYLNDTDAMVKLSLELETGVLKVFHHTYQVGKTGTNFDFVNSGGQEILFPFQRFTANADIKDKHRVSLLYQPLTVETRVRTRAPVTVDGQTFAAGSDLNLVYGFPFWRGTYSYLFDLGKVRLGLGLALQLRNASISFSTPSGAAVSVSQNLGPVPAFHLSALWTPQSAFSLYAEATGLYASSALINGANFAFEGSILDASVRPTAHLKNGVELFLNLRFLGGSAQGTSQYDSTQWSTSVERYTANYLATGSLTLGASLR
jgi:hypothetical protein